jgi:CTP-dependent riboflavin kinase
LELLGSSALAVREISLKVFTGKVKGGYGVAGRNLAHVMGLIEQRTGLGPLIRGTLNLAIPEPYIVIPDAQIEVHEYNHHEYIKLQRCRIASVRAIIMRPNTHESGLAHGPAHLELLAPINLREHLQLRDGQTIQVEVEGDEVWWKA